MTFMDRYRELKVKQTHNGSDTQFRPTQEETPSDFMSRYYALKQNSSVGGHGQKTTADYTAELESARAAEAERQRLLNYDTTEAEKRRQAVAKGRDSAYARMEQAASFGSIGSTTLGDADLGRKRARKQDVLNASRSRYEQLDAEEKELARDIASAKKVQTRNQYDSLAGSADFADLSAYNPNNRDALYRYINGVDREQMVGIAQDGAAVNYDPHRKYQLMSDEDKAIYNYLTYTQGSRKANEFLEFLDSDLRKAQYESDQAATEEYGKKHPITGSIFSVPANLVGGIMGTADIIGRDIAGVEQDPYSDVQGLATMGQTMRQGTSEDMGAVGSFLYNAGMSVLDSLAASTLPGKFAPSAVLSSTAFASTAQDIVDRGGSDKQAIAGAAAAAAFEWIFESISIGNFKSMKEVPVTGVRDFIGNLFKSGGVNASEETLTELANIVWDTATMGDISQWKLAEQEYIDMGYAPKAAMNEVIKDMAMRVLESGAAGFLTGIGFGTVGSVQSAMQNNTRQVTKQGKQVVKGGGYDALVEQGLGLPTTSQAYQMARGLSDGETKKTNWNVGLLSQAVQQEQAVATAIKGFGTAGKKTFDDIVENTGASPDLLVPVFESAYEMGRNGEEVELEGMSNIQKMAYTAGQMDALQTADGKALEMGQQDEYTEGQEEVSNDGEGVYLREGSERDDGADSSGQIPGMEESTGRDQGWDEQGRPADEQAASLSHGRGVKVAKLGIVGGSNKVSVWMPKGKDTVAMAKARKAAKARGLEVVFFGGNDLLIKRKVRQPDGSMKTVDVEARGYISGNRVYVRVDHAEYTADQIMRHELGHDMIDRGDIDPKTVRERIRNKFGEEKAQQLADMYAEAYKGSGMTADEIWNEVICDSLGDMNIFAGLRNEGKAQELLTATKEASADAKAETSRGPPAGDGKMSREFPITRQDIAFVQSITGNNNYGKSINNLTAAEQKSLDWLEQRYRSLGVKSPFYRARFGDWREFDTTPITVIPTTGAPAAVPRGTYKNIDTEWDIQVSGKVGSETRAKADPATRAAVKYLPWVPEIAQHSVLFDSTTISASKRKSENSLVMHSLYAALDTKNGPTVVQLLVEEMYDPNANDTTKRAYLLADIKEYQLPTMGSQKSAIPTGRNNWYGSTIADLFAVVKVFDKKFTPKPVSKVDGPYLSAVANGDMETAQRMVDEAARRNGYKPVSRYHQTAGGFTEFSTANPRAGLNDSETPNGIFFKDNDHDIGLDGKIQLRAYLKAETMLHFRNREEANKWYCNNVAGYASLQDEYNAALKPFLDQLDKIEKKMFDAETTDDEYDALYAKEDEVIEDMRVVEDSYRGQLRELLNTHFLSGNSGYDGIELDYDGHRWVNGKREDVHTYIVFRSSQAKSADPVTYDDNGNIIPLSERFDTKNPDIRFSQELPEIKRMRQEQAELRRENEKLKQRLAHWKGQVKRTKSPTLRQSDVEKLTKRIVKDYDSTIGWKDLVDDIKSLGEVILRGGEGMEWSEVNRQAMDIARRIVTSSQVLSSGDAEQILTDLEDYLNSTDSPSYDVLQDMFGETYFPSDITDPAEQMEHISKVRDELRSLLESDDMEQTIQRVANDLLDDLLGDDVRQTPPTFADRQAAKMEKQKDKAAQRLSDLREQKNERIKEVRQKSVERTKEQLAKVRADRDAKLEKLKDKHRTKDKERSERQKAGELRRKIERHVAKLSTAFRKPTDSKHVPEELRGAALALLESINLESSYEYVYGKDGKYHRRKRGTEVGAEQTKRTDAARALREAYEKAGASITVDPDLLGTDGILEQVSKMGDIRIADMTTEQLTDVWKAVRSVEKSISDANKLLAQGKFKTVLALANAIKLSAATKTVKGNYGSNFLGKAVGWGDKMLHIEMLDSLSFFHLFGSGGDALYHTLQQARDHRTKILANVVDMTLAATEGLDVKKLQSEKHTFTTEGGDKITLTTGQIMSLYALSKRKDAQDHIYIGGIRPSAQKQTLSDGTTAKEKAEILIGKENVATEGVHVTRQDVQNIIKTLTSKQVEAADALQAMMSGYLAEEGNKASMAVYGYEKFNDENYFPISSDPHQVQTKIGDPLDGGKSFVNVASWGAAKSTQEGANNGIVLGDMFDIVAQHSVDMATYASHLAAMEDVNRVRNFQFRDEEGNRIGTMGGIIERVAGKNGAGYLEKLFRDIGTGVSRNRDGSVSFSKFTANQKAAQVGANFRVILQQPTSYLRAMALVDPKYLLKGVAAKGGWEKALKYAPIAQWKDWGNFEINQGRQIQDIMYGTDSGLEKVKGWSMALASKMDSVTWGALWNACELEVADARPDLTKGTDAFYEAVAQRFTDVVDQTQVVDNVLGRSQIMRSSDGLAKMATSFLGEPTKQYNMLYRVATDVQRETDPTKRNSAKKSLAVTAASLVAANFANAIAQSLWDAVRDDEDPEEKYWERFVSSILPNFGENVFMLNSIPYIKDIISIVQGYDVKRTDLQAISDLVNSISGMYKAFNGEGRHTIPGSTINMFASLGTLFGVPTATIKRDMMAIMRSVAVEVGDYEFLFGMEKLMNSVASASGRGELYSIMYSALHDGDVSAYKAMKRDMIASGVKESSIEGAMKSRYKNKRDEDKSHRLSRSAKAAVGIQ